MDGTDRVATGGTRTRTRLACGFENEYHFMEYKYDFLQTFRAFTENSPNSFELGARGPKPRVNWIGCMVLYVLLWFCDILMSSLFRNEFLPTIAQCH